MSVNKQLQVIILAAGKGTRLAAIETPKPLTELENGKTILEMQIERLQKWVDPNQIFIVVGYQKEKIISRIPQVNYVHNDQFDRENTSQSLLKALNEIKEKQDVLWMNGDVLFCPKVLDQILKTKNSAMVVNQAQVKEEEIKYRSYHGNIIEVSKNVLKPEGEALGINLVKAKDVHLLKQFLKLCKPQDYFEKGIELAIQNGLQVSCVTVHEKDCVEIDFAKDLKKANALLSLWQEL